MRFPLDKWWFAVGCTIVLLAMSQCACGDAQPSVAGMDVGAAVDESMFPTGGNGVTLHVSLAGDDAFAGAGRGSVAHPFASIEAAAAEARQLQYGVVTKQVQGDVGQLRLPCWFKLARTGDVVKTYVRYDEAGPWQQAGTELTLKAGADCRIGVFVNSDGRRGDVTASFDHIAVNGQTPQAVWQGSKLTTTIISSGGGSFTGPEDNITVTGHGYELTGNHVYGDNGMFVAQTLTGDGEMTARLAKLTLVADGAKKAYYGTAGIRLATGDAVNDCMVRVAVTGDGAPAADMPAHVTVASRIATPSGAKDVKISIAPGIYRLKAPLILTDADILGRARTLVIEGAITPGKNDVILSGSESAGWEPSTWKCIDPERKIYSHDWANNWGFGPNAWSSPLSRRREMIFINGRRLDQILLEDFAAVRPKPLEYKGFREPVKSLAQGSFGVAEFGPKDGRDATIATAGGKKTFAEIYSADPSRAAFADQIFLRLPWGMSAQQFAESSIEVAVAPRAMHVDNRDNIVLRNLTVEHFTDGQGALVTDAYNNWSPRALGRNENWLLDNVHFDDNRGVGVELWWVNGLTIKDSTFDRNGDFGFWLFGERMNVVNVSSSDNNWAGELPMNFLVRDSRFERLRCSNSKAFGLRMDHLAENVEFIDSQFNGNLKAGAMFETTIGPITFRNCQFKDTAPSTGGDHHAGIILSTVHNATFDGCTFANNGDTAIMLYPRERSHLANVQGQDEMCKNIDAGQFSTFRDEKANRAEPGKQKPANEARNLTIINCKFVGDAPNECFFDQSIFKRNEAYGRTIGEELVAYNNTYWNPANATPFVLPFGKKATFEQWKAQAGRPEFEAGSYWGRGSNPQPPYIRPATKLATASANTAPQQSEQGVLRYAVDNLKFTATQPVESIDMPTGGHAHKLLANRIGDYGDSITYTLNVPTTGDYYVNVRYLQDAGRGHYLGYAQLSIDGVVRGNWWDEHGLTEMAMDVPLGQVKLTAGDHRFRFRPVWRNGYGSAAYHITVDRIDLSTTQLLRPADTAAKSNASGLTYADYENDQWTRLPDFSKLKPAKTGQTSNFDITVRTRDKGYAVVFDGFLDVPQDGIYTLLTTVNDGANLYLGGDLVLDNDGVHDGERNQPWQKQARVALAKGLHPIRIEYFDAGGTKGSLAVAWEGPGIERQAIPSARLCR